MYGRQIRNDILGNSSQVLAERYQISVRSLLLVAHNLGRNVRQLFEHSEALYSQSKV